MIYCGSRSTEPLNFINILNLFYIKLQLVNSLIFIMKLFPLSVVLFRKSSYVNLIFISLFCVLLLFH